MELSSFIEEAPFFVALARFCLNGGLTRDFGEGDGGGVGRSAVHASQERWVEGLMRVQNSQVQERFSTGWNVSSSESEETSEMGRLDVGFVEVGIGGAA